MSIASLRFLPAVTLVLIAGCSSNDAPDTAASEPGAPASIESPAPSSASAAELTAVDVSNYELTMDKMKKFVSVANSMGSMTGTAADSAAMNSIRIGNDPVDVSVRKMEAVAPMKRALAASGLAARDYVMIAAAYMQAGMMMSAMESNPNAKVPPGQSIRNVEFMRTNKAELERLMKGAGLGQ